MREITYIILTILTGTFAILGMSFIFMMHSMGFLSVILEEFAPYLLIYLDKYILYIVLAVVILIGFIMWVKSNRCRYCGRFSMSYECDRCISDPSAKPLDNDTAKKGMWGKLFLLQIVCYIGFAVLVVTVCNGFGCFFASIWVVIFMMIGFLVVGIVIQHKGFIKQIQDAAKDLNARVHFSESESEHPRDRFVLGRRKGVSGSMKRRRL